MDELLDRLRNKDACSADEANRWMVEAADTIQRMQEWLEGDCCCPCCAETRKCASGCTFADDCPNDAEKMAGARVALYGRP